MKARKIAAVEPRAGWDVLWCGSLCADNPHPTEEAARAWIEETHRRRGAARIAFYGHYEIKKRPLAKEGK